MSQDTSASAFPWQLTTEPGEPFDPVTGKKHGPGEITRTIHTGLSIRDYMAAKALIGLLAGNIGPDEKTVMAKDGPEKSAAKLADAAYLLADAMLAERAK